MPPRTKSKGDKGKRKKDGSLDLEEKFIRTMNEIESLRDHLGMRKDVTRQSKLLIEEWKEKVKEAERQLESEKHNTRDILAELVRQYKVVQAEMNYRIAMVEKQLVEKCMMLNKTENDFKALQEEHERVVQEKDQTIQDLHYRINSIEKHYEFILREALENLLQKIDQGRYRWEKHITSILEHNKQTLQQFGFTPADI